MTGELADQDGKPVAPGTAGAAPEATPARKRVSRWDRPPEPHDWRFFVGWLGKVLITVGVLMFGFVAYQLWGTGIETARSQNRLENQFEELVAANTPGSTAPTTAPTTTPPTTPAPSTEETTDATTDTSTDQSGAATTPPATAPPAVVGTTPPVEQDIPPIERGRVLAKLEIPRIGKVGGDALYVVPGVEPSDLKKGPGHYPDTPLPGQLGNAAIAGHRTTFGEPFRHVDELDEGDEIIVTMANGDRFVYAVTWSDVVEPDDYQVVTTTDPNVATLTLTSCHPVYSAKQRIVVQAVLVPEQSSPVGRPTYYDLDGSDDGDDGSDGTVADSTVGSTTVASAADDPTVAPQVSVATSVDASDDAGSDDSAADSGTDASSDDSADDEIAPVPSPPEIEDAFADGWFHDSAAWPQILLWATPLIAIAFGMRWLSHRFRSYTIGIAAGALPFLVCLYFFYQNVNRLLPPGF